MRGDFINGVDLQYGGDLIGEPGYHFFDDLDYIDACAISLELEENPPEQDDDDDWNEVVWKRDTHSWCGDCELP
ncbi:MULTISPECIES: hypothetical protein [Ralstonia]|uniref:hypothetical protein n=1 Tax=Ralstonia TaxID=48736 RepID=UPI001EE604D6|nr:MULTISPECIES: hypothetical protein [Ralstonia]